MIVEKFLLKIIDMRNSEIEPSIGLLMTFLQNEIFSSVDFVAGYVSALFYIVHGMSACDAFNQYFRSSDEFREDISFLVLMRPISLFFFYYSAAFPRANSRVVSTKRLPSLTTL